MDSFIHPKQYQTSIQQTNCAGGHFSIGQSVTWDDKSSAGDSTYSAKSSRSQYSTSSSTSRGKYVIGNVRAAVSNSIRKMEGGMDKS